MTARRIRPLVLLAVPLLLAGCLDLPDMRGPLAPRPATTTPAAPVAAAPGGAVPASTAESVCMAQGRAQGLAVQGVVGTREVAGPDGQPVARDVMLRVARGQQVYDVRCNYRYAEAEARIMSL